MRLLASMLAILSGCGLTDPGYDHAAELAALAGGKADGPAAPHKQWTFILYGAADNNLADDIRHDVNELESVGSTDAVNMLAFLDRPEGARVFYLERDADPTALPSPSNTWGTVDSGSADTLIDVVDWAIERFPADRVALVISGHGGGTPRVIAPDFSTGHAIDMQSLERAIQRISTTAGPLDLFGADACLMQSIELGYQLHDDTAFVVGSENTEPGNGWDYVSIGSMLVEPDATAPLLAEAMVGYYARAYRGDVNTVTLSALETAALTPARRTQLADLAGAMQTHAQTATGNAELRAIANAVLRVETTDTDFADAVDLAQRLQTTSSPQLQALARQLELTLSTPDSLYAGTPSLIHVAWGRGGTGASVYFPTSAATIDSYETGSAFAADTGWATALRAIW